MADIPATRESQRIERQWGLHVATDRIVQETETTAGHPALGHAELARACGRVAKVDQSAVISAPAQIGDRRSTPIAKIVVQQRIRS